MSRFPGPTSLALAAAGFCFALVSSSADAQTRGSVTGVQPTVSISGEGEEIRAAGARVSIDGSAARIRAVAASLDVRGAVEGDIWAAGADVSLEVQAGGDLRAAGASTIVRGHVAGNVAAAGAVVDLDLSIDGNLRAAGASVLIGPMTTVGGDLRAAAASINYEGQSAGSADFAGGIVTLNGHINGPVTVHAERVVVGPNAVLGGDLLVRSINELQLDQSARVDGTISRIDAGDWLDGLPPISAPMNAGIIAVVIIVPGLFLLIFARATYGEAIDHVRFQPLASLLFGLVGPLVIVALAIMLMATLIGLPLGIGLLLILPIISVLGLPVAAGGIVGWVSGRGVQWFGVGRLLVHLLVGALILAGLCLVPVTGGWIVLAIVLFGIGGLIRATLWRFRIVRPAEPIDVTPGIGASGDIGDVRA